MHYFLAKVCPAILYTYMKAVMDSTEINCLAFIVSIEKTLHLEIMYNTKLCNNKCNKEWKMSGLRKTFVCILAIKCCSSKI